MPHTKQPADVKDESVTEQLTTEQRRKGYANSREKENPKAVSNSAPDHSLIPPKAIHFSKVLHSGIKFSAWKEKDYIISGKQHGGAEVQGNRKEQQDQMVVAEKIHNFAKLSDKAKKQCLVNTVEELAVATNNMQGGSTAIMSVTCGNKLYTAGVGDAVSYRVYRNKKTGEIVHCKRLNNIHNPNVQSEKDRIEKAGGSVSGGRVNGLAVSRAFGDLEYREYGVTAEPDIQEHDILLPGYKADEIEIFQVTACDGLTEQAETALAKLGIKKETLPENVDLDEAYIIKLFNNNQVYPKPTNNEVNKASLTKRLKQALSRQKPVDLGALSADFIMQALADGSGDNISVSISRLNPFLKKVGIFKAVFDGHRKFGEKVAAFLAKKSVEVMNEKCDALLKLEKNQTQSTSAKASATVQNDKETDSDNTVTDEIIHQASADEMTNELEEGMEENERLTAEINTQPADVETNNAVSEPASDFVDPVTPAEESGEATEQAKSIHPVSKSNSDLAASTAQVEVNAEATGDKKAHDPIETTLLSSPLGSYQHNYERLQTYGENTDATGLNQIYAPILAKVDKAASPSEIRHILSQDIARIRADHSKFNGSLVNALKERTVKEGHIANIKNNITLLQYYSVECRSELIDFTKDALAQLEEFSKAFPHINQDELYKKIAAADEMLWILKEDTSSIIFGGLSNDNKKFAVLDKGIRALQEGLRDYNNHVASSSGIKQEISQMKVQADDFVERLNVKYTSPEIMQKYLQQFPAILQGDIGSMQASLQAQKDELKSLNQDYLKHQAYTGFIADLVSVLEKSLTLYNAETKKSLQEGVTLVQFIEILDQNKHLFTNLTIGQFFKELMPAIEDPAQLFGINSTGKWQALSKEPLRKQIKLLTTLVEKSEKNLPPIKIALHPALAVIPKNKDFNSTLSVDDVLDFNRRFAELIDSKANINSNKRKGLLGKVLAVSENHGRLGRKQAFIKDFNEKTKANLSNEQFKGIIRYAPLKGVISNSPEKTEMMGYIEQGPGYGGAQILGDYKREEPGQKDKNQEDRMLVAEEVSAFALLEDDEERKACLKETFDLLNEQIKNKDQGSTAVISIKYGSQLYTAGLGDSVSYLIYIDKKTKQVAYCELLNKIHNTNASTEADRINNLAETEEIAGVISDEHLKVGGYSLGITRAFGDKDCAPYITAELEEVSVKDIQKSEYSLDDYQVLQLTCSDGLTDAKKRGQDDTAFFKNIFAESGFYYKPSKNDKGKNAPGDQIDYGLLFENFIKQALYFEYVQDNISGVIRELDPNNKVPVLTAIFDGHGGDEVSTYLKEHFVALLNVVCEKRLNQRKELYNKITNKGLLALMEQNPAARKKIFAALSVPPLSEQEQEKKLNILNAVGTVKMSMEEVVNKTKVGYGGNIDPIQYSAEEIKNIYEEDISEGGERIYSFELGNIKELFQKIGISIEEKDLLFQWSNSQIIFDVNARARISDILNTISDPAIKIFVQQSKDSLELDKRNLNAEWVSTVNQIYAQWRSLQPEERAVSQLTDTLGQIFAKVGLEFSKYHKELVQAEKCLAQLHDRIYKIGPFSEKNITKLSSDSIEEIIVLLREIPGLEKESARYLAVGLINKDSYAALQTKINNTVQGLKAAYLTQIEAANAQALTLLENLEKPKKLADIQEVQYLFSILRNEKTQTLFQQLFHGAEKCKINRRIENNHRQVVTKVVLPWLQESRAEIQAAKDQAIAGIAQAIFLQDCSLLSKLKIEEVVDFSNPDKSPSIANFVKNGDALNQFIERELINCKSVAELATKVERWIEVAHRLSNYPYNEKKFIDYQAITTIITSLFKSEKLKLALQEQGLPQPSDLIAKLPAEAKAKQQELNAIVDVSTAQSIEMILESKDILPLPSMQTCIAALTHAKEENSNAFAETMAFKKLRHALIIAQLNLPEISPAQQVESLTWLEDESKKASLQGQSNAEPLSSVAPKVSSPTVDNSVEQIIIPTEQNSLLHSELSLPLKPMSDREKLEALLTSSELEVNAFERIICTHLSVLAENPDLSKIVKEKREKFIDDYVDRTVFPKPGDLKELIREEFSKSDSPAETALKIERWIEIAYQLYNKRAAEGDKYHLTVTAIMEGLFRPELLKLWCLKGDKVEFCNILARLSRTALSHLTVLPQVITADTLELKDTTISQGNSILSLTQIALFKENIELATLLKELKSDSIILLKDDKEGNKKLSSEPKNDKHPNKADTSKETRDAFNKFIMHIRATLEFDIPDMVMLNKLMNSSWGRTVINANKDIKSAVDALIEEITLKINAFNSSIPDYQNHKEIVNNFNKKYNKIELIELNSLDDCVQHASFFESANMQQQAIAISLENLSRTLPQDEYTAMNSAVIETREKIEKFSKKYIAMVQVEDKKILTQIDACSNAIDQVLSDLKQENSQINLAKVCQKLTDICKQQISAITIADGQIKFIKSRLSAMTFPEISPELSAEIKAAFANSKLDALGNLQKKFKDAFTALKTSFSELQEKNAFKEAGKENYPKVLKEMLIALHGEEQLGEYHKIIFKDQNFNVVKGQGSAFASKGHSQETKDAMSEYLNYLNGAVEAGKPDFELLDKLATSGWACKVLSLTENIELREKFEMVQSEMAANLAHDIMAMTQTSFNNITAEELLDVKNHNNPKSSPGIAMYSACTYKITYHITQDIVNAENIESCREKLKRWIEVADICYRNGNYAAAIACVASFSKTGVSRLLEHIVTKDKQSLEKTFDKATREKLTKLRILADASNSHKTQRSLCNADAAANKPFMPLITMYLGDLTSADGREESNTTTIKIIAEIRESLAKATQAGGFTGEVRESLVAATKGVLSEGAVEQLLEGADNVLSKEMAEEILTAVKQELLRRTEGGKKVIESFSAAQASKKPMDAFNSNVKVHSLLDAMNLIHVQNQSDLDSEISSASRNLIPDESSVISIKANLIDFDKKLSRAGIASHRSNMSQLSEALSDPLQEGAKQPSVQEDLRQKKEQTKQLEPTLTHPLQEDTAEQSVQPQSSDQKDKTTKSNAAASAPANYMDDYERLGDKQGGRNSPGAKGGIYTSNEPDKKDRIQLLFKQDTKRGHIHHDKNIAEFLCSSLMAEMIPGSSAKVILAATDEQVKLPDETGANIYIGSIFLGPKYRDLFKDLAETQGKKLNERPYCVGSINKKDFHSGVLDGGYQDFAKVMVPSLLLGDFDIHSGNIGVIGDRKLVRIDFAAGLRKLGDKIHPHSRSRHLPGFGPTNHFREYPRSLRTSIEMADELERIANISNVDIEKWIDDAFMEIAKYYGAAPISDFAVRLGFDVKQLDANPSSPEYKAELIEKTRGYLVDKLRKRQVSLREFALEIRIDHCFKKVGKQWIFHDKEVLDQLIRDNADYFKAGKFHFRANGHRDRATAQVLSKMLVARAKQVFSPQTQEVTKVNEQAIQPNIAEDDNRLLELGKHIQYDDVYNRIFNANDFGIQIPHQLQAEQISQIAKSINDYIASQSGSPDAIIEGFETAKISLEKPEEFKSYIKKQAGKHAEVLKKDLDYLPELKDIFKEIAKLGAKFRDDKRSDVEREALFFSGIVSPMAKVHSFLDKLTIGYSKNSDGSNMGADQLVPNFWRLLSTSSLSEKDIENVAVAFDFAFNKQNTPLMSNIIGYTFTTFASNFYRLKNYEDAISSSKESVIGNISSINAIDDLLIRVKGVIQDSFGNDNQRLDYVDAKYITVLREAVVNLEARKMVLLEQRQEKIAQLAQKNNAATIQQAITSYSNLPEEAVSMDTYKIRSHTFIPVSPQQFNHVGSSGSIKVNDFSHEDAYNDIKIEDFHERGRLCFESAQKLAENHFGESKKFSDYLTARYEALQQKIDEHSKNVYTISGPADEKAIMQAYKKIVKIQKQFLIDLTDSFIQFSEEFSKANPDVEPAFKTRDKVVSALKKQEQLHLQKVGRPDIYHIYKSKSQSEVPQAGQVRDQVDVQLTMSEKTNPSHLRNGLGLANAVKEIQGHRIEGSDEVKVDFVTYRGGEVPFDVSNIILRLAASEYNAERMLEAMVADKILIDPNNRAGTSSDQPLEISISSMTLLSTWVGNSFRGKTDEVRMVEESVLAWRMLKQKEDPIKLTIGDREVFVKFNVLEMNMAVKPIITKVTSEVEHNLNERGYYQFAEQTESFLAGIASNFTAENLAGLPPEQKMSLQIMLKQQADISETYRQASITDAKLIQAEQSLSTALEEHKRQIEPLYKELHKTQAEFIELLSTFKNEEDFGHIEDKKLGKQLKKHWIEYQEIIKGLSKKDGATAISEETDRTQRLNGLAKKALTCLDSYEENLKQIKKYETKLDDAYRKVNNARREIWLGLTSPVTEIAQTAAALSAVLAKQKSTPELDRIRKYCDITQEYAEAQTLFYETDAISGRKSYTKKENWYEFQARFIHIGYELGNSTKFKCKSLEDRTGKLAEVIKARSMFRQQEGRLPKLGDKSDNSMLQQEHMFCVEKFSISRENTHYNGWGARGKQTGTDHEKKMAKLDKGFYSWSKIKPLKLAKTLRSRMDFLSRKSVDTYSSNAKQKLAEVDSSIAMDSLDLIQRKEAVKDELLRLIDNVRPLSRFIKGLFRIAKGGNKALVGNLDELNNVLNNACTIKSDLSALKVIDIKKNPELKEHKRLAFKFEMLIGFAFSYLAAELKKLKATKNTENTVAQTRRHEILQACRPLLKIIKGLLDALPSNLSKKAKEFSSAIEAIDEQTAKEDVSSVATLNASTGELSVANLSVEENLRITGAELDVSKIADISLHADTASAKTATTHAAAISPEAVSDYITSWKNKIAELNKTLGSTQTLTKGPLVKQACNVTALNSESKVHIEPIVHKGKNTSHGFDVDFEKREITYNNNKPTTAASASTKYGHEKADAKEMAYQLIKLGLSDIVVEIPQNSKYDNFQRLLKHELSKAKVSQVINVTFKNANNLDVIDEFTLKAKTSGLFGRLHKNNESPRSQEPSAGPKLSNR